jgi:molybdopterin/thiamine biosynthesis adenylyltransferase
MPTQKEMIKEAMQAIAQRKPGRSKLVYDKASKTIVAVSTIGTTPTGLNISSEDADMFGLFVITIATEYLNSNWGVLATNSFIPIKFSEWDDGDTYTPAEIGAISSHKLVGGAIVLEDAQVPDFPIKIRLRQCSSDGRPNLYQCPDGTRYEVTAEKLIDGAIESVPVLVEAISRELSARRHGLLETDLLKDRSVLIIGLGTGGMMVAIELAKAGVGKLVLVDHDRLKIGNISRHGAGISFVGRKKVAAARDLILETNPLVTVETYDVKANEENEELLRTLTGKADLIICATDNRPSKLFINSLCVEKNKCVIFGGAFQRAYGGQVLRVRPRESACYHCLVLVMPEKEADQEISSQEDANAIAYSDRPVAVEPGLSMDVAPIAIMVSKLALQELIIGKESTLHILDADFDAGLYRWGNRPEPKTDYASCPPLSNSPDEITILRWYGVYLERDQGCPTCGDFEKAIREKYGIESGIVPLPTQSEKPAL